MTVYMRVTKDKYRLPVAMADTVKELAKMCDTTANSVSSAISHGSGCFIKVEIEDDEDERKESAQD